MEDKLFHSDFEDFGNGVNINVFNNFPVLSSCSSDLLHSDKPLYCSILMSRQQLQQIINNKNLFDDKFVEAANLVAARFDETNIEYTN